MASVLYSSARAVVMEKTLLGEDRLKRMVEGTADDALKILSEVGFGTGDISRAGIDAVSDTETARLCSFIKETAPDDKIKKFFLLPYDFKNAEALIKEKYLKTESELSAYGLLDVKELREKIFTDSYSSLPKYMAQALLAADKAFVDGTQSGLYINGLFTKALYNELFALNVKDKRLKAVLLSKADLINIGISLRTRNFERAEKQYVHFGKVKERMLKVVCESDFDTIREQFRFTEYKDEVFAALSGIESGAGLKEFEKLCDGFAVKTIKKDRYSSQGILPFIRYCFYKFADIANARIVLVGHSGGLTHEEISDRLREHYEG